MVSEHDMDWLSSVLPSSQLCSSRGTQLELHKRLVHLATLRETALSQLHQLDAVKVSLTERKVIQQSRLVAALDARLASAHAAVEPHRAAVHDHIKALEKAAAYYSNVLQGVAAQPSEAEWMDVTHRYQQLLQQQEQHQQQVVPAKLSGTLACSLQPCPVSQVEAVEQLRAEKDQLLQDLREAHSSNQQVSQEVHNERAARLLAEQQQHGMQQEITSLRQLADNVAMQLQGNQQQQLPGHMYSQRQLCPADSTAAAAASPAASCNARGFLLECQQLRQQLQCMDPIAASIGGPAAPLPLEPGKSTCCSHQQSDHNLLLQHHMHEMCDPAAVLAEDPLQELKQSFLTGSRPPAAASGACCSLGPAGTSLCRGASQESRLRHAYQQMLKQVQTRYQQELRQTELQHQQALQSQAQSHTETLTKLTQQHQEACTRLAAAAADEAEAQQRVSRLQQDNLQLEQQVQKLQQEVSAAASGALALAQIQHEQQLLAVKHEHQQLVQQAKEELDSMRQQLRDQAAAVPDTAAVAAMVRAAAATHMKGQEEAHQSAVQQQQQQHMSLLQELYQLRQLNLESSENSISKSMPELQQREHADLPSQQRQKLQPADSGTGSHQHEYHLPYAVGDQPSSHGSDMINGPVSAEGSGQSLTGGSDKTIQDCWQPSLRTWKSVAPAAAAAATHACEGASTNQKEHQQQQPAPSAMCSLITAVLGTGQEAKAMQAAHAHRMQQQEPSAAVHSTAALLHAMDYTGQLAQLDQVLGLKQQATGCSAVDSNRQAQSPDRARPSASVTAEIASQRAAVAEHIQRQAAADNKLHHFGMRSRSNSKSPPVAIRQQQQQQDERAMDSALKQGLMASSSRYKACLRCGSNDASSPGRCCFHPGFVPVPGPLMYSPEWHACRASCTPDMPGCYSRREHCYLPQFDVKAGTPNPAGQLRSRECRGITGPAGRGRLAAAAAAVPGRGTVSPMRVHGGSKGQATTRQVSRSSAQQQVCRQGCDGELTPRSTLPKPTTPRTR